MSPEAFRGIDLLDVDAQTARRYPQLHGRPGRRRHAHLARRFRGPRRMICPIAAALGNGLYRRRLDEYVCGIGWRRQFEHDVIAQSAVSLTKNGLTSVQPMPTAAHHQGATKRSDLTQLCQCL